MKQNMGMADRVIRTLIAIGIAVLYFTGRISGTLAIILGGVAVAFLLSSLVGAMPGIPHVRLFHPQGTPGQLR